MTEANARWLRSQRCELIDDADLGLAIQTRAAAERPSPSALGVGEHTAMDGLRVDLAKQLCAMAGRVFTGWIARIPRRVATGPGRSVDTLAWIAATTEGPCTVYFVEGRAILADRETTDALARLPIPF